MSNSAINQALFACNILGLALALALVWAARKSRDTPDGRARILSSISVGAFAVAGLAKRFELPDNTHIILAAWVVVLVAQAWKLTDQRHTNHDQHAN